MAEQSTLLDLETGGPNKEARLLGALCYAPFGCFLPVLMQKQSEFLAFHTKRGGLIFGVYFILNIIPFGLFWIFTFIYAGLAGFAGWKAYNGERFSYSFVEALFEKFKK